MTVADVNAVVQAFHDAVASQDAAALASLYHEDARLLAQNMEPVEGRSAIQAALQQLLDIGIRSVDLEPIEVREAGDLTIEYGRYTTRFEPEGAEPITDVGKYLVVHETRQDGSTKYLFDCFNSNSPLPTIALSQLSRGGA